MRSPPGGPTLLVLCALTAALVGCSTDSGDPSDIGIDTAEPDVGQLLPDDRGEPPDELVVEDVAEGEGAAVTAGALIEAHVGALRWSDAGEVAWTWSAGQPYRIEVGAGQVIEGFEQGVVTMREGGRRMLIVPPGLAYGEDGAGTSVGPDETLVFVVDLLSVDPDPPEDAPGDDLDQFEDGSSHPAVYTE